MQTMTEVHKTGFSRVPVFDRERSDVVALIEVKDLMLLEQENMPVRAFVERHGHRPVVVWHDDRLGDMLRMFRGEGAEMAVVRQVVSKGQVRRDFCSYL